VSARKAPGERKTANEQLPLHRWVEKIFA